MARGKKTAKSLTPEQKLEQALVPVDEQLYRIPKNWCWTTLGTVAQWGSGGTPSRKNSEYFKGNILWVKTGELNDGYIYDTEEKITDEAISHSSAKLFPPNTVVIAMYGATIGKVGILGTEATTNQACACGVCSKILNYIYLFYYVRLQKDAFIGKSKGGAQPNISQDVIKRHAIPLAPLAEQQRIVDHIERLFVKLDGVKEKVQAVVDSFELRKSAVLHKAFAGHLTIEWARGHGGELDSWERVELADVCVVNPKKIDMTELPDDLEVSFFPMSVLSEISGEIITPQTKPLKEVRTGFTNFAEGDVVFAKITPCMENGKSAVIGKLVNDIGFGSTEFYVFRCRPQLYNRYLYHLFRDKHFRDEAKSVMAGAVGQQRVPKSFLVKYPLNLPSVSEQKEIVRILDIMFTKELKIRELSKAVLDQITTMKKSILSRAFRGELGTNDSAEECAVELLKTIL